MNKQPSQRESERIDVEINALLRVTSESESRIYPSKTRNLSAGGACIVVERGINDLENRLRPREAQVLVALELYRGESEVKAAALPVWIRSTTDWVETPRESEPRLVIGLSFVDMGERETEEIKAFLAEVSKPSR